MHLMTYALGDGADAEVTKQLACASRGISHVIAGASNDELANAMASYYTLLSPMLSTCQTRWVTYTDILTQTELLGACIALNPACHPDPSPSPLTLTPHP